MLEVRTLSKKEMLQMRLEGMPYRVIAEKANISRQRVQQLLSPPTYIRRVVITAAKGKCQNCGISIERLGHVHHVGNSEEDYNDVANLIFLCPSCHRKTHESEPVQQSRLTGLKLYWQKKRVELRQGYYQALYLTMARYDSLRKLERNKMLRDYAASHPDLSLKEIGKAFNISESRVCRLLKPKAKVN